MASAATPHEIEAGAEVFTEDGRRAIYAGEIDGQKFVRIILSREDDEYGPEEWAADKLTPVSRVLTDAPVEAYAPAIERAKADLAAIRDEAALARKDLFDLRQQEQTLRAASKRYPDIATALDFLEGRITHVVVNPEYQSGKVMPLGEFLASSDYSRTDGLKLLSLFGVDEKGALKWRANQYRDGSGFWTEIVPFRSEAEALRYQMERFETEVALWRAGEVKHRAMQLSAGIPEERWPDDWRQHVASLKAKNAAERIAKLREQIEAIEAEQVPA